MHPLPPPTSQVLFNLPLFGQQLLQQQQVLQQLLQERVQQAAAGGAPRSGSSSGRGIQLSTDGKVKEAPGQMQASSTPDLATEQQGREQQQQQQQGQERERERAAVARQPAGAAVAGGSGDVVVGGVDGVASARTVLLDALTSCLRSHRAAAAGR